MMKTFFMLIMAGSFMGQLEGKQDRYYLPQGNLIYSSGSIHVVYEDRFYALRTVRAGPEGLYFMKRDISKHKSTEKYAARTRDHGRIIRR
jgi:hypothetical protein